MKEKKMDKLDRILSKVLDISDDIEQNMFTKSEHEKFKSDIFSHIDGFIKLHETLDQELVSLRHKYDRLDERLTKLEQRVH